jgi:uncharacterized membrane protein YoaK (UPF0700 family)
VAARDALLVGLAFSAGAADAISYLALGKLFTAFMTGDVVVLGLRLADGGGQDVARIGVTLAAFGAGAMLAFWIVRPSIGAPLRLRRVSLTLGLGACAQAAFLGAWIASAGRPGAAVADALTGLSALAMGLQGAAALALGLPGAVASAAVASVAALAGEIARRPLSPRARGRLAGVLLGLLAGVAAGAALLAAARPVAPALPLGVSVVALAAARACPTDIAPRASNLARSRSSV